MKIEYEATFIDIDKNKTRDDLKKINAQLVRKEFLQKRYNFDLQPMGRDFWEWVRVRDEGDRVTMAYKNIAPESGIDEQLEVEFEVNSFDSAVEFMNQLGARNTNYSETLREIWSLDGVEIMIDTWPHLEPYVEIEGTDENSVKKVSEKLGFDWGNAKFCGAGQIYEMKYGVHPDKLDSNKSIKLTFDDLNPFIK